MSTLLCFHAHPDDEAIATAGLMMGAAEAGHRVILVLATRGEHGAEPSEGLDEGATLGKVRSAEAKTSAEILSVDRLEFLGYTDSGMEGEVTNTNPDCFWQADVEQAAQRLADLLADEDIDVMTIYDDHGGYDHPDHIQVHRVGTRFASLAGIDELYWATMNRDAIARQIAQFADKTNGAPEIDTDAFGMAEADITHAVNAKPWIQRKSEAMKAHASQIDEESFFLTAPPELFAEAFGTEWFHSPANRGPSSLGSIIFEL